jgi:hypothetical protein
MCKIIESFHTYAEMSLVKQLTCVCYANLNTLTLKRILQHVYQCVGNTAGTRIQILPVEFQKSQFQHD